MNDKKLIKHLFKRLLDNSITKVELDELLNYVRNSDEDNEVRYLMDLHWEEIRMNLSGFDDELRSDERYSDILGKIDQRNRDVVKVKKEFRSLHKVNYQWIGIAASFLILVSIGIYWFASRSATSSLSQSAQVASVNYSGKQFVLLPDGSSVVLNEGSELSYTETFGQQTREVSLDGEGYFDIAHDAGRPFIVHTGDVKTTVLGTAFNLTAYENQSDVVVTVARGKVSVGDKDHEYEKILPKEQLVVHKRTLEYEKEEVDLDQVLAWKDKFLILDGMSIESAVELIGKRHHVEIAIDNEKMKNCKINAAFMKGESLEQILRVICGVLQAEFKIEAGLVTIMGGRECE